MSLATYLVVLRRRWTWVAICALLGFGLAGLSAYFTTPTYRATSSLFISLQAGNSANDLAQGATYTQDQIASYVLLATSPTVLDPVIDELGLDTTARGLAGKVAAQAVSNTVVLSVSVTDPNPVQAATIANAVSDELGSVVEGLAAPDDQGASTVRVTMITPAVPPSAPAAPRTTLQVAAGLLAGLALGAVLAVVRDLTDTRVRDGQRAAQITDAPLLGAIPQLRGVQRASSVVLDRPLSPEAEAYRQVATNVEFLRPGGGPLQLGVSSSLPGEGKSTIALNIALALAESDQRVLLVDADLRRPSIATKLDLEGGVGLSTVLVGKVDVADAVQEFREHGLHILTSGAVPPNPGQLLASPALATMFEDLASRYDVVVVDTAPILPVSDALLLSRHLHGTLLVAGGRSVRRNQLVETVRRMATVEAPVLGVVVNQVASSEQAYGYGGYQSIDVETVGSKGPGVLRRLRQRSASLGAPTFPARPSGARPSAARPATAGAPPRPSGPRG